MSKKRPLFAFTLAALVLIGQAACGRPDPAEPEWTGQTAVPFAGVDPTGGLDDLEPLRRMIGDARVVALGEATHGTREFFRMKHRVLRFLVERMGFTAFGIEATWPECNRIDHYVQTGEGDPEVLLSGQYFWTWNTREVLDMIRWMRSHNAAGGRVAFHGFDMQFPGMAIDNVTRFIRAADERSTAEFTQHLECLARYANDPRGRFPAPGYADQRADYREACLQGLRWAHETILARRDAYVAATSATEWTRALRSARVAIQYEEMASSRASRDAAMAENAAWLLDQAGPGGKIVLWAHNGHVKTSDDAMGGVLRQTLGREMVVIGFAFGQGSFSAVRQSGSAFTGLTTLTADPPEPGSYEDHFASAGMPRFMLDLRNAQGADMAWLAGPLFHRNIGCCYDPARPAQYWQPVRLPNQYDMVIYFADTTPSEVLPFRYPTSF